MTLQSEALPARHDSPTALLSAPPVRNGLNQWCLPWMGRSASALGKEGLTDREDQGLAAREAAQEGRLYAAWHGTLTAPLH